MTHKTIQIEENAQHENESLVMMEREQGYLQRHDHLFFELAYITGGTCEHTLNDIKTVLHRGDYFFIDLGSTHRYENSCGLTLINCLFLPEAIDETMRCCLSLNELLQACLVRYYRIILGANWTDCVFHDEDGRVGALLGGMVQEYRQMQFGSAEIFRGRLTEILILTLRKLAPYRLRSRGKGDPVYQPALRARRNASGFLCGRALQRPVYQPPLPAGNGADLPGVSAADKDREKLRASGWQQLPGQRGCTRVRL